MKNNKYKGKYDKCRTCKHVIEVMMELVEVKETCPYKSKFSIRGYYSDKHRCQECDKWEVKE